MHAKNKTLVVLIVETVYMTGSLDVKALANEPCVMALGFFDGIHLGHRELIETSKQIAQQKNLTLSVMTFFPHPSNVLPTNRKINRYLSPLAEKKEIFKALGVEKLFIVTFNHEFAEVEPADFVQRYICGLNCKHVVAGFDFTYGHKGKGNMDSMKEDGNGKFDVTIVKRKSYKDIKISSTKIRELLEAGTPDLIPHYLGDHYSTHGWVESVSFNLKNQTAIVAICFKDYLLPRKGIYLVELNAGEQTFQGVCSITENSDTPQKIHIQSKQGPNIISSVNVKSVNVKWLTELETLSPDETIQTAKKAQMVV